MDALGLQASQTSQEHHADMQRRARIPWPKLEDEAAFGNFDADVSNILETTLQGNAERKMESLTNIVYIIGKERFGVEEEKSKKAGVQQTPNRRERRIRKCRQELNKLNKQFRKANEMEKAGIAILTDDIRSELSKLRRAERLRQKRKHKEKNRAQFIKNPFNFTKGLLGQQRSGRLHCPKEEVEAYLQETHSDEQRDEELGPYPRALDVEPPKKLMEVKEPTWREVTEVVRKARSGSAPGPNGIPYKVYKKCPKVLRKVWQLFRVMWRKRDYTIMLEGGRGMFRAKREGCEDDRTV